MFKLFFYLIFLPYISYGYFFSTNNVILIEHNSYSLGYSTNFNQALWCEYTLTSNQVCCTNNIQRTNNFRPDPLLIDKIFPSSYHNSGYDKGHLCPAKDRCYCIEDMSETFYMSNMSPQDPFFNRGIWKRLEEFTRNYAISNNTITVITGPVIFDKHFKIDNKIVVPNMYYKILITTNNTHLCFLLPNQQSNKELINYIVNLQYLKTITEL